MFSIPKHTKDMLTVAAAGGAVSSKAVCPDFGCPAATR